MSVPFTLFMRLSVTQSCEHTGPEWAWLQENDQQGDGRSQQDHRQEGQVTCCMCSSVYGHSPLIAVFLLPCFSCATYCWFLSVLSSRLTSLSGLRRSSWRWTPRTSSWRGSMLLWTRWSCTGRVSADDGPLQIQWAPGLTPGPNTGCTAVASQISHGLPKTTLTRNNRCWRSCWRTVCLHRNDLPRIFSGTRQQFICLWTEKLYVSLKKNFGSGPLPQMNDGSLCGSYY